MANKESFEKWLNEQPLSETTIKNYLRGIRYVEDKFSNIGGEENILNVYGITEFSKINEILNNPEFIAYDNLGNRMSSSGLKKYKEFLGTVNKYEGDEDILKKSSMIQIEDVVLIKINKSYKENMTPEELYHATSFSWVASFGKTATRNLKYYCAVYQNEIIEVYDFLGFEEELPRREPARYILQGKVASDEIKSKLIGLDIGDLHKGSGNPIKYTSLKILLELKEYRGASREDEEMSTVFLNDIQLINHIYFFIISKGFSYSLENIKNLYLSLRSKPFVIISGISGTGKTKIVRLFAESIGATEDNGQFKLIPVRPDWSDSSELLGYADLTGKFIKGPLTEMIERAAAQPERPHFVLLDEMNLARVEYYFSDILSVMESRNRQEDQIVSSVLLEIPKEQEKQKIYLPNNLYIIGTVNMDETTYPFSKKVLDRANTIEFNEIDLNNFSFLENSEQVESSAIANEHLEASFIQISDVYFEHKDLVEKISTQLSSINQYLSLIKAEVGYRVRDEICFYMVHNAVAGLLSEDEAMDFCYMQKILPRISGGQAARDVLMGLREVWTEQWEDGLVSKYPKSIAKVDEMLGRLKVDGFTSFWIS
ncbi:AAA family ATPase [Psychrobacillus sp. NEAU-3TGS]|uniref:McrB family protein n=1 Tax=Psychrobacillus sp. NEAU-3TGS TaxID=2995412 RepID=UPI0024995DBC|nr:AAA family ATPase [Psychrobacillus sp. NEAU-3TGS]MDI2587263.1 AAA family ATPase [Psychrobacillus sp. NEAU-3TGS]